MSAWVSGDSCPGTDGAYQLMANLVAWELRTKH